MVVRFSTPFGLGQNGCWTSQRFQLPRAPSFIFLLCCSLNDRSMATHSFLKIGRLFSLFSCSPLARHHLLIFLLFLMSGNVYPNPGPIFPCSVCTVNVTWRGKSVQCCTCSKWVHLRSSQLFSLNLELLTALTLGAAPPPCCVSNRNTVTLSSDFSDNNTSTIQSSSSSANAALPPHPCIQTSYPPAAHFVSSPFATSLPSLTPGCPSTPSASSPLTLSGFFKGMLEVFEPEALNNFTCSRPILLTKFVSRNPISAHLPLSEFLDSLLCVLIAPTPGLAFSLLMPRMLAVVSSFS